MKKNTCIIILSLICFSSYAQGMKNYLNKELIANIGSICEETSDYNPCAGSMTYLTLLFNKKEVTITEKDISSCGKEFITEIGKYNWELLIDNKIKIHFNPEKIKYTQVENLLLELGSKNIIGKKTHWNNNTSEYIFEYKN